MTTPSVMPAVRAAGEDVRRQLLDLAGDVFEANPADLALVGGRFRSADGALDEPVSAVTEKLGDATIAGDGGRGPNPEGRAIHSFGCQIAQVAVDPGTGEVRCERVVAVHDIGRVINPLNAASQVEGGVLQGMAFALLEEYIVDPTTGAPVTGTLDDYKLPTIADMPEVVVDFVEVPDRYASSVGAKGLGEPPIVPTAAAIANAFAHATGRRAGALPLTPARVIEALRMRYARPAALEDALELLRDPAARPIGGGTDLLGQVERGIVDARASSSTSRPPACTASSATATACTSAPTTTLAELASHELLAPYAAVRAAASSRRLAAAAQRRHRRRQPLPGHALLVLPRPRVALLARRRRHLLRADRRPPQAQPAARRLHLGASLRPRAGPRGVRRGGRRRAPGRRARAAAARPLPPADGGRPLAADPRAGRGRDDRAPARAARRLGLRARRRAAGVLVRAGVRRRGPQRRGRAPGRGGRRQRAASSSTATTGCAGLPGNPQSAWKRHVLATLVDTRPGGRRMIATIVLAAGAGVPLRLAQAARGVVGPAARGARARRRARRRPARCGRGSRDGAAAPAVRRPRLRDRRQPAPVARPGLVAADRASRCCRPRSRRRWCCSATPPWCRRPPSTAC